MTEKNSSGFSIGVVFPDPLCPQTVHPEDKDMEYRVNGIVAR